MAIASGMFAMVTDQSGLMIALPSISEHFNSSLPTAQWVLIAYVLAVSIFLLPMGKLADLIGHKYIYTLGLVMLTVNALLAGFAPSIYWIILASFLRGIGSGMCQGSTMAIVVSVFGPGERGKALGLYISVVGIGAAIGPLLAGAVINEFTWRWLFFLSTFWGICSIVAATTLDNGSTNRKSSLRLGSFDWIGILFFSTSLVALLLGMTQSSSMGFSNLFVIVLLGISVSFGICFVLWESKNDNPILDLNLFRQKTFSLGVGSSTIFFLGNAAVLFVMPFYLQSVLGYPVLKVGLMTAAGYIAVPVIGPLSGRLADRFGPGIFMAMGMAICSLGLLVLANITMASSWNVAMLGMILANVGLGFFYGPNNKIILNSVASDDHGVVSGFVHLIRNSMHVVSMAITVSIITMAMVSSGFEPNLSDLPADNASGILSSFVAGFKKVFWLFGSIVCLGVITAFFLEKSSGKNTEPLQDPPTTT